MKWPTLWRVCPYGRSLGTFVLHLFRCADAQQVQTVGDNLPYGKVEADPGVTNGGIFNQYLMGVVIRMELARQVPQVVREMVRLTLRGGIGNELRILGQLVGQFFL